MKCTNLNQEQRQDIQHIQKPGQRKEKKSKNKNTN